MITRKLKDFGFRHKSTPHTFTDYIVLTAFYPEVKDLTMQEIMDRTGYSYEPIHKSVGILTKNKILEEEKRGKTRIFRLDLKSTHAFTAYCQYCAYNLLQAVEGKPVINRLKHLSYELNPMASILHGSYADHTNTKESDIDIVIVDNSIFHPDSKKPDYQDAFRKLELEYAKEIHAIEYDIMDLYKLKKEDPNFVEQLKLKGTVMAGYDLTFNIFYR